ncbi:unnamed protein product [Urochloa decumbens]|uniref:TF-B3 domain-containing protein n=1 Tax=Urochloa decumbens TaxID=240449 RepID=A0ABC8Y0Z1_9POAL
MGRSCRRCKLRAENAYKNLDDHQKYFLMPMKGDFQQAMTIPGELVERFRSEIPAQITLRTRNSNCSTVEVAKYPDKIVISAGWAAFVDTYDLHMHGSILFKYGENSQFYVIIFDQFGCEEVLSVLEDYAHLAPHDPERCIECCESCKDLDEYKYCNLDNEEKYFLVSMKGDFQHEMTVPAGFVKRFKGEFPGEIKLETRNGESYCVGVVRQPDKVSFSAGWGVFVKTYDLHIDDSLVFKYNGSSRFNVIVLSRVGYEKATSVVVNDESVPLHVQKSTRDDIESGNPSHDDHPETETMQMRSPPREQHASLQTDSTTQGIKIMVHLDVQRTCRDDIGSVNPAHEHSGTETMQMRSLPWERQTTLLQTDNITQGNMTTPHPDVQRTRRDDIEFVNPAHHHPETMPMQSMPREKHTFLQRDTTVQGNKTNQIFPATCPNSSANYLLSDNDGLRSRGQHPYVVSQKTRLTENQNKKILERIQCINSGMPISVAVICKSNVHGSFDLNFPKQHIVRHLGRKERTIFLQRDSQRYAAKLSIGAVAKVSQGGWRRFVRANDVEVGDICLFELLKDGETCTINVHIIRSYEVAD